MVSNHSKQHSAAAFTLRELVVVVAVGALLLGVLTSALQQSASRRVKQMQCAANLRQFAQAVQLYASENREALPSGSAGSWAWDLPGATADGFQRYGMERRSFYCPGTAPRFNDQLNYLNPGFGSLWGWGGALGGNFRIIGYVTTLSGTVIGLTNQNRTILPEPPRLNATVFLPIPKSSERVLLADATISENTTGTAANPAPAGSFANVAGGFSVPHISPHLKGTLPAGGNLAYKDGHVAWRPFSEMSQRATSGRGFWW
jgi:type II secretory pathway pseudopilin PulG